MAETNRVTLRSERTPDGEVSLLEAYIDDSGDLVLEGYDLGETVKEVWGDADYEYWRRVKREHLPAVLLLLLQERFTRDSDFHAWLAARGIPDEFSSWV